MKDLNLNIFKDLQDIDKNAPNKTHFSGKLASHDSLNEEQMHQLRDSKKGIKQIFSYLLYFYLLFLEPKGEEEGSAEDITESEVNYKYSE